MNLQPQFFAAKLAQLNQLSSTNQKLDQIFEWVKTGHISRAVFKDLVAALHSHCSVVIEQHDSTN